MGANTCLPSAANHHTPASSYAAQPHLLSPCPQSPTTVAKGARAKKGDLAEKEKQDESEILVGEENLKEDDKEERSQHEKDQEQHSEGQEKASDKESKNFA